MYTRTYTTHLANGVTQDKLVKVLHHHATILEVLVPRKVRHELQQQDQHQQQQKIDNQDEKPSASSIQTPTPPRGSIAEKFSSTSSSTAATTSDPTVYLVSEPASLGMQKFKVLITGRADGCDTMVFLPGGARIKARWRVEEEVLVEEVEVGAGCWNRRSARKRVDDHFPRQHDFLMQLAATSKSMTGSYPLLNPHEQGEI